MQTNEIRKERKLIDISTKTFISVLSLLFLLMVGAIILTYVLPKGEFNTMIVDGEEVVDYSSYNRNLLFLFHLLFQ